MSAASSSTKRRGRKPRGGIANLDDILAYPTQESSSQQPLTLTTEVVRDPVKSLAPIKITSSSLTSTNVSAASTEVHMHHVDYPWHEDGFDGVITPHEFQIRNAASSMAAVQQQQQQSVETKMEEDLDDVDVFPNDDFADYETVFRTQTNAGGSSKTLHMSARDREAVEVFRPQQVDGCTNEDVVPEHMRIISLPLFPFVSQNREDEPSSSPPPTAAAGNAGPPVPEFYHPFRIHFHPPEQHHCLDDGISWPSKSPFVCWWCRHNFDGYPKVSPVSVRGNDIEVVGNFCSWNCSKAWTLQHLKRLDMFNTLYHVLFGTSSNEVNPAPTYLAIDTFGGPFTVEQFRAGLNNPERQLKFETFSNIQIVVSKMFIRS